jgi:hypothetical protein
VSEKEKVLKHLEYGAQLLVGMLRRCEESGTLVPEVAAWLKAERSRRALSGHPKETP